VEEAQGQPPQLPPPLPPVPPNSDDNTRQIRAAIDEQCELHDLELGQLFNVGQGFIAEIKQLLVQLGQP
jgi:hypothetical protein